MRPQWRRHGVSKVLYEKRVGLMKRYNLRRMVAYGRLPGYTEYAGKMTAEEYVQMVVSGEMSDPSLSAHLRAGWQVAPAYMGLGFNVRGTKIVNHQLGTLTSPETFGNYGAGSTLLWVDPELDVSFAACSAGVMTQTANIARFQKISDTVVSAMV